MARANKLNILVPMAGRGGAFLDAGYTFPKPLIDVDGRTMVEVVVDNIKPKIPHRFIFVILKEQYEKYDFHNIFKKVTDDSFKVVTVANPTQGAAVTALAAIEHIDNSEELLIANADQFLNCGIEDFVSSARKKKVDGYIMTFKSSHPKWSYARTNKEGKVIETAEKQVISEHATAGVYYYKKGGVLVKALKAKILKNIRHNGEFYICPAFNEMIIDGYDVQIYEIPTSQMHGMGTPEELVKFQKYLEKKSEKHERKTRKK